MADLTFVLYDLNEREIKLGHLKSYELCRDADAPCDSLRITFINDSTLPEAYRIMAFCNGKCVFNGYVDTQRESLHQNHIVCFLYCRSSACLLTDSEAKPFTYTSPSARALFEINAGDEFKYNLGSIYSDISYQVGKGTSLYGAINGFVYSVTGEKIRVTPENELVLLNTKKAVKLDEKRLISAKRIINRGNALSQIDYKISNSTDYIYHRVSDFMKNKKITARKIRNISTVPDWQRETTLKTVFSSANADYCGWELIVQGYAEIDLCDEIKADVEGFEIFGKAVANSVAHILDSSGERTVIRANYVLDLEEMSYVDE